jgi:hypothetical protein
MALPNSTSSPAVLSVANLGVILAWVGAANNIQIMLSTDGVTFQTPLDTGMPSGFPPALTSLNGRVFMAWLQPGNGNVNVTEVTLGKDGNGNPIIEGLVPPPIGQTIKVSTNSTPGFATYGNQLLIAFGIYAGPGGTPPPINVMWTGDLVANPNDYSFNAGYQLTDPTGSIERTWEAPVLVTTQTRGTFMAWKGWNNIDISIAQIPANVGAGGNAASIPPKRILFGLTGATPGLTSKNDELYVAYKAYGGNNIYILPEHTWPTFPVGAIDTHGLTYSNPILGVKTDQSAVLLGYSDTGNVLQLGSF